MVKEVDTEGIKDLLSSLKDPLLKMVLYSITEGNTEGRLWSSDPVKRDKYFLWDKGNIVFYLFGGEPSDEFIKELSELFEDEIRLKAQDENLSHFKFDNMTGISDGSAKRIFGDTSFEGMDRYLYEYSQDDVGTYQSSVDSIRVMDIDKQFLNNTENRNLAFVINEIKWMWPSFERYYESGFGKAALNGDEIVCWCTAEYVSESKCGIGIETLDRYRQKGIEAKTASEFIYHCLDNDITAYWDCDASNEPSVRLAEKLGFDKIREKKVWLGRF